MGCWRKPAPVSLSYQQYFTYYLYLPSLRCLEHAVNLTNIAVMGHITKITVIDYTNVIWEYDPLLLNNHVLGGSLNVIAVIQTLAVKVCTSTIKPYLVIWYDTHAFLTDSSFPDSILNTSRSCKLNARSTPHSRFSYTTIHSGVQHTRC